MKQMRSFATRSSRLLISPEKIQYPIMTVLFALTIWAGAAPATTGPTATESVKHTITAVIHILDNEELKKPGRSEDRRREIEQVVRNRVSYEEMAKQSLGTPWKTLNDGEKQEFVDLFVQLLRDTFCDSINKHSDEQVVYLNEQRKDTFAEVRTRLTGHKIDIPLNFRLLMNQSGDWLVYDVVIDGMSIVGNYRAQFTRTIHQSSYAGLVENMRQKALVLKFFEKTTSR